MGAGIGAVGDTVAVDVEIAAEVLGLARAPPWSEDLAAVVALASSHFSGRHSRVVHADVEIEHHEHRRLQPVREIEGLGAELEGLGRVLRDSSTCLVSPCEA